MSRVAPADSDFVTRNDATVLEENMKLLYLPGHIVKLQSLPLIVGQGVAVPVVGNGIMYVFIET